MNLYVTNQDKTKIRKAFLNLRKIQLICVDEIIEGLGYEESEINDYSRFIVNKRIEKIISTVSAGKKMQSIIYVNYNLNDISIREIIRYCETIETIENVIFLTDRNKYEDYYELFDEIVFFPSIKKIHILECKSLDNVLDD